MMKHFLSMMKQNRRLCMIPLYKKNFYEQLRSIPKKHKS